MVKYYCDLCEKEVFRNCLEKVTIPELRIATDERYEIECCIECRNKIVNLIKKTNWKNNTFD